MSKETEVVSVKRERLAACMTCGICHNLLDKATVVSECLHTFCKDCIFMKLTEEESHCCPVCKLDLGPSPLQKLRNDNNLQEVRAKLFPCKRGKVNPPEAPSVSVVNTQVGIDTTSCGNEMREFTRKSTTSYGLSLDTNGIIEKENINTEYCAENPNSPVALNKDSHDRRQNSPEAETPCITYNKDTEKGPDKDKLSKTLECLEKDAFSPQSCIAMTDHTKDLDTDLHIPKTVVCGDPNESIVKDGKNDNISASERSGEAKRLRRVRRKKELAAQALLDAAAGKHDRETSPVWVTLVASADQDGNAPLPQLPKNFLRIKTDNNLQEVRAKLFPCKRGKVNPLEAPSVSVVNTQLGTDTVSCGNEMREFTRKSTTSHGLSLDTNGIIEKENINTEFCAEIPNSPVTLDKVSHDRRQNSPEAETPCITYNKDTDKDPDKDKLSTTLECIGKAAFSPQSCIAMTDQTKDHDTDLHIPKIMICPNESIAKYGKNDNISVSERSGEAKRLRRVIRKKELAAQALLDAAAVKHERGTSPVWVTLVVSADQDGNAPLPQLPKNFLRIKNCSLPSSFLQKYIAKKLNLSSETEVDISCQGQPVYPTTPLHGLVEMWVQKEPSNKVQVLVGSSAKDFVVVITYRRKGPPRQWTDFSNHGALSNPFKSSLELQQVSDLC